MSPKQKPEPPKSPIPIRQPKNNGPGENEIDIDDAQIEEPKDGVFKKKESPATISPTA